MTRAIHWFRNDLRLRDNTALIQACSAADELALLFVFDDHLLSPERLGAPRLRFLLDSLERLAERLEQKGQRLVVKRGDPVEVLPRVLEETRADLLSFNRHPTPYGRSRDRQVVAAAKRAEVRVLDCSDHVVFEADQVVTQKGEPYSVYTPYNRAWRRRYEAEGRAARQAPRLPQQRLRLASDDWPRPRELGFEDDGVELPTGGELAARRRLASFIENGLHHYTRDRDRPALDGTSRLSPYLRFGALSVRECFDAVREAAAEDPRLARGAGTWTDELIWREFYAAVLEAHPRVARHAYRPEFEGVKWNDDEEGFRAWCQGRTGYPFVDAGMRQLAATGWMHNRARMAVASFLTKDLLIDWRQGERFFFRSLVDGDPASNNGGWQWSASTGTDAAPYFRIFNPVSQSRRFDPTGEYLRRWVPELRKLSDKQIHEPWKADSPPEDYPEPVVDHAERRSEALERYQAAQGRKR